MSTRNEKDFTLEAGRYKATFTEVCRLDTTKETGCNHEREPHDAYGWRGKLTIRDYGYARDHISGEFRTDTFFAEAVGDMMWEEVIFLVLMGDNQLHKPEILASQKQRFVCHLIERILLNYFLSDKDEPLMKGAHIRPLRCWSGQDDELLYGNVFSQFIPIKKAVAA